MDERGQRRRRAAALARAAALSALRPKGRAGMDPGRLDELVAGNLSRRSSRNSVRGLKEIVCDAVSRDLGKNYV